MKQKLEHVGGNRLPIYNFLLSNNSKNDLIFFVFFSVYYIKIAKINGSEKKWWFTVITYTAMRFSECLNPLFYNIASR